MLPLRGCYREKQIRVAKLDPATVDSDKYVEHLFKVRVLLLKVRNERLLVYYLVELEETLRRELVVAKPILD
jgi:hypothetical protein